MGFQLDHKTLTTLLDDSARQLPPTVISRLSEARQLAVQRQAQSVALGAHLLRLTTAWSAPLWRHRVSLGMALLAALLLTVFLQIRLTPVHDHSAIDLAILTDDLPIEVYVE